MENAITKSLFCVSSSFLAVLSLDLVTNKIPTPAKTALPVIIWWAMYGKSGIIPFLIGWLALLCFVEYVSTQFSFRTGFTGVDIVDVPLFMLTMVFSRFLN